MERGSVLACQFHPELSGAWGLGLLARWAGVEFTEPLPVFDGGSSAGHLLPRIIPCLDVRGGRIVKGVKFANLRDAGDPVERAALYEREGADEIVILDVSATTEERAHAVETVERVRAAIAIPLTVGGGVRRVEDAARLLDAGADKVAVNTAAVSDPGIIDAISERFGRQCTVLAVDAAQRTDADGWEVVVRSGTERTGIDAVAWCVEGAARGAGEILLTSWDRDGTGEGYDLALLEAVCGRVGIPVIASGGVSSSADLGAGLRAGASAVLAASIFHDGVRRVVDVKREVTGATGIPMRACKVKHASHEGARP
ncbi:MAG: imidazole glycerol phosphate synthase subunit HisF [Phycisphaeraceae bacterium]|nr:MAG: imidazole glycerol phosphate synthase subunit HisF [Phycisphaeraceae bacterium]